MLNSGVRNSITAATKVHKLYPVHLYVTLWALLSLARQAALECGWPEDVMGLKVLMWSLADSKVQAWRKPAKGEVSLSNNAYKECGSIVKFTSIY